MKRLGPLCCFLLLLLPALLCAEEELRYFYRNESPALIRDNEHRLLIQTTVKDANPVIGVEVIFTHTLPPELAANPEAALVLYNSLHEVSRLEGIEYFSASRGKMRTFFSQAWRIESPENNQRQPDAVFETAPASLTSYIFQEDLTFGKNTVQADYYTSKALTTLIMTNLTQMKYGFIPVVDPGKMTSIISASIEGEQLIIYSLCIVEMPSLLGLERTKKDSFYNRLKALDNWLCSILGITTD